MKKSLKALMLGCALGVLPTLAMAQEIAVIVKTTNSNYWQNVRKGAEAAIAGQSKYKMTFEGQA